MVGVPGRSKACSTCRKRRKGCDLQRPICGQCQRGRLECGGYVRQPPPFINWTGQAAEPTPKRTVPVVRPENTDIALPNDLARSAYEQKYLGIYWEVYLPNGRTFACSNEARHTLGGWTTPILDLYQTEPVLRKSVLALSLSIVGRRDGQDWAAQEGLSLYVGALKDMTAAMLVPSRTRGNGLFCAAKMFTLYEAMFGADNKDGVAQANGWLAHGIGEMAMMVSKGPEHFVRGHSHYLFAYGRLQQTVLAIRSRKRSVLSTVEWKTIPWTEHTKTAKDYLLDILVDTPGLLEDIDAMNSSRGQNERETRRARLAEQCWLFDRELVKWHASTRLAEHLSNLPPQGDSTTVSTEILAAHHLATLYWTTCLIVYSTLGTVVDAGTQELPARADPKVYCRRIASAVAIFFHPAVGTFRTHLAAFPIGMALMYMSGMGADMMETERKLLAYFDLPEGAGIGTFLDSMKITDKARQRLRDFKSSTPVIGPDRD